MRRWALLILIGISVIPGSAPALAQVSATPATVGVEPGPAVEQWLLRPCNDAVVVHLLPQSFVLRRSGPATDNLTVSYTTSGTAQPGVHFEPLPGVVTFGAGADTVAVPVTPRPGPDPHLVDLTLQIQAVSSPAGLGPSAATIEFVSPWDQRPVGCGYRFTADGWNRTQSVVIGEPLHALTLEQFVPPAVLPAPGVFRVVSGFLPLWVQLQPDGTFSGRPLVPGTSVATVDACRPAPPGTCVTTELTINVLAVPREVPPCPWPGFASLPASIRSFLRQILPVLASC